MKIAFDVSYVQRRRAGVGRHAIQLLRSLLTYDRENEYVLHGWSWKIDKSALAQFAAMPNVTLSVSKIPGDVKRFYWNHLRQPSIESVVGEAQIFHSMDPLLPPVRRAKTLCTVHDLAYKLYPDLFEDRVKSWDAFVHDAIDSADRIIVPSDQTRADLCELFAVEIDRVQVIQLPPDPIFTAHADSEFDLIVRERFRVQRPFVLFVGTIEPRKQVDRIVAAFERMQAAARHDVELVLVGKRGWLYDDVFRTINNSPERGRIRYVEFVSERELASLYRQALCFVYPSLYEGYGFPVLEAMASGVPIITSNTSSLREIADGVALLVPPTSTEDLADGMEMLITNEVRRVEMRQRGLHIVQQFTAERAARQVLSLYDSLR